MQELLNYVPEVIVVGNIEFAVAGAALALGFPKAARWIVEKRTNTDLNGDGHIGQPSDEVADEAEK
jgi:uncharacterized membrane protein YfbV (UPF0208 family)